MTERKMRLNVGFGEHPDHAVRIGNILACWNSIEDICAQLLVFFIGTSNDQSAMLLHSIQGAGGKIAFVRAAGEYALKSHYRLAEFDEIMDDLNRLNLKVRIPYVHHMYGVNEKGQLCILNRRYSWKESQKGGRHLPIEELDRAYEKLKAGFNAVVALYKVLAEDQDLASLLSASFQRQTALEALRDPSPPIQPSLPFPPAPALGTESPPPASPE